MTVAERARAMRADGKSFAQISQELDVSLQWAHKCAADVTVGTPLKETESSVVRYLAHNGGCSTLSGMQAISLPRIPTIDGAYAS